MDPIVKSKYELALKRLEKLEALETELDDSIAAHETRIADELEDPHNVGRIASAFERAITAQPLHVAFWLRYAEHIETTTKDHVVSLPTIDRHDPIFADRRLGVQTRGAQLPVGHAIMAMLSACIGTRSIAIG